MQPDAETLVRIIRQKLERWNGVSEVPEGYVNALGGDSIPRAVRKELEKDLERLLTIIRA